MSIESLQVHRYPCAEATSIAVFDFQWTTPDGTPEQWWVIPHTHADKLRPNSVSHEEPFGTIILKGRGGWDAADFTAQLHIDGRSYQLPIIEEITVMRAFQIDHDLWDFGPASQPCKENRWWVKQENKDGDR